MNYTAEYKTKVKKFGKCGVCKRKVWEGNTLTFRLYEEYGYRCSHS